MAVWTPAIEGKAMSQSKKRRPKKGRSGKEARGSTPDDAAKSRPPAPNNGERIAAGVKRIIDWAAQAHPLGVKFARITQSSERASKMAVWIKLAGAAALVCVGLAAWFSTNDASGAASAHSHGMVSGHRVGVRTAPRLTAKVVFRADWATPIEITDREGNWARVVSADPAFHGWIEEKYVGQGAPSRTR